VKDALMIKFSFHCVSRFDEVHFGRFTTFFLNGTFFFDVHPPFAKLVYACTGILKAVLQIKFSEVLLNTCLGQVNIMTGK
jgi:dolichyl-phosphate-mannose--protein O-mannosyl transferase